MLVERHQQQPSSFNQPWGLILYTDEITLGNVLATAPTRKVYAIYYSFKELGHALLRREDAWICALVLGSSTAAKFQQGALANVIGALLKVFFAPGGTNMEFTGLHLGLEGCPSFRLFAKLSIIVQDGLAHKELWGCRDGTRLCMRCLTLDAACELTAIDARLKSKVLRECDLGKCSDADVNSQLEG